MKYQSLTLAQIYILLTCVILHYNFFCVTANRFIMCCYPVGTFTPDTLFQTLMYFCYRDFGAQEFSFGINKDLSYFI